MKLSRRKFTRELKVDAVRLLESGRTVASVARAYEVDPALLHRWRQEYRRNPMGAFPGVGRQMADEHREAELECKIGRLAMENDFLKRLLERFEEDRRQENGGSRCTRKSRQK